MKAQVTRSLLATFTLLVLSVPMLAHHSSAAEFDIDKEIHLTGTITKVDWINPHTYIYVEVKDGEGKLTDWGLETWPTGMLHRYGIKRDMFVIGQTVVVTANPAKDPPKSIGFLRHVTFQNGDEINFKNNYVTDDSK